jgi:hypothetical protein
MDYLVPQEFVIGAAVTIILLFLQLGVVFLTSKNYVWNRFRSKASGRDFVELIDVDGKSKYTTMYKQAGELIGKETEHIITPGSVTRNADGDIYHVNKRAGLTPNPQAVEAANRIRQEKGYTTFSEALYAYIIDTHKEEYDLLQKQLLELKDPKDQPKRRELQKNFDRLVKKDLYEEGTNFTQDLSILYEWTAQPLDAYANRTLAEQQVLDAEKKAKSGGIPMDRVFQYVIVAMVALGGIVVILILLRSTGFNVVGGDIQAVVTTTTTTLPKP